MSRSAFAQMHPVIGLTPLALIFALTSPYWLFLYAWDRPRAVSFLCGMTRLCVGSRMTRAMGLEFSLGAARDRRARTPFWADSLTLDERSAPFPAPVVRATEVDVVLSR